MGIWFPGRSYLLRTFHNYVLLRIASDRYCKYGRFDIFVCSLSSLYYPAICSHRDLILYTITVGKITEVQTLCYICRRQNYRHNSNFIPKTFANLIEPKMWPLCMARNGEPSVDVRIHSWPGPTMDLQLARANCGQQLARAIPSRPGSPVGSEQTRLPSATVAPPAFTGFQPLRSGHPFMKEGSDGHLI